MSQYLPAIPPDVSINSIPEQKSWTVGTLHYTREEIFPLFFWLMWNDFCLVLKGYVPALVPILMKDLGASNAEMGLYMGALTGALTIWINPVVSTWSDRHRGPYGRRRPFLFVAAPLCALFLCAIPFVPWLAPHIGLGTGPGKVMLVGLAFIGFTMFNSVISAIFAYYYWDVVPLPLLARFSSIAKIVTTLAGFLWSFFIFGLAEKHMQAVFVGISVLFLIVYTLSLWKVKEGDYPPPPPRSKGALLAPLRRYFIECFSQPYYRWVFAAGVFFQIGNFTNMYQIFYFRDTLGMSLDTIGKMTAWPMLLIVLIAYPVGAFMDRLNPIRLVAPSLLLCAAVNLACFFFLRGPWTLLIWTGLLAVMMFLFSTAYGVMNVEVFPREKIGQFCSANQISASMVGLCMSYPVGLLIDYIKDYRYTFIWSAVFQLISALMFLRVYMNWKRVGGCPPVPDAN